MLELEPRERESGSGLYEEALGGRRMRHEQEAAAISGERAPRAPLPTAILGVDAATAGRPRLIRYQWRRDATELIPGGL